jgi:60S ribosomal subunit assembly/export protein LOC1
MRQLWRRLKRATAANLFFGSHLFQPEKLQHHNENTTMAPMQPTKRKAGVKKPSKYGSSATSTFTKPALAKDASSAASKAVKSKVKKPEHLKKKRSSLAPKLKKRRIYTEKELGIPTLNAITPAGVLKPHGTKKGKIFVDDRESQMTILAMVNAEQEGQVESKMMKARQMEEIREARRKEAEARQAERKGAFEEVKNEVRRGNKKKGKESFITKGIKNEEAAMRENDAKPVSRKRVSFGGKTGEDKPKREKGEWRDRGDGGVGGKKKRVSFG